jgi:hypothetical protein
MPTPPPPTPLASAWAVCCGHEGDVAARAGQRGVRRQTLCREAHPAAGAAHRQQLADLRQRRAEAERRGAELPPPLAQALVCDRDRLAEFAATAPAEGGRFPAAHARRRVRLRQATPSVARLGRRAHAAGRRAAPALAVRDRLRRPRARPVAPDELFSGKKPVRRTVAPHSLVAHPSSLDGLVVPPSGGISG